MVVFIENSIILSLALLVIQASGKVYVDYNSCKLQQKVNLYCTYVIVCYLLRHLIAQDACSVTSQIL